MRTPASRPLVKHHAMAVLAAAFAVVGCTYDFSKFSIPKNADPDLGVKPASSDGSIATNEDVKPAPDIGWLPATGGTTSAAADGAAPLVTGGITAPVMGGIMAPPTGGIAAPATGGIAPLPTGGNRPPATGGITLPATGGNPPPATGGNRPPATGGITLPATGGNTPPATGGITLPATGGNAPPATGGNTPPRTGGSPPPDAGTCAGEAYGGVCWYLGATGANCQKVCANHGQVAPEAASFVGTTAQGGSATECKTLFGLLGTTGNVQTGSRPDGLGLGCHLVQNNALWWLSSPNFSESAGTGNTRVVCGCTK